MSIGNSELILTTRCYKFQKLQKRDIIQSHNFREEQMMELRANKHSRMVLLSSASFPLPKTAKLYTSWTLLRSRAFATNFHILVSTEGR